MDKTIQEIINDLKTGEMDRNLDESSAGGFWDRAGEIASIVYDDSLDQTAETIRKYEQLQERIYEDFYDIAEICLNKDFNVKD